MALSHNGYCCRGIGKAHSATGGLDYHYAVPVLAGFVREHAATKESAAGVSALREVRRLDDGTSFGDFGDWQAVAFDLIDAAALIIPSGHYFDERRGEYGFWPASRWDQVLHPGEAVRDRSYIAGLLGTIAMAGFLWWSSGGSFSAPDLVPVLIAGLLALVVVRVI